MNLNELVDFFWANCPYLAQLNSKDELREALRKHIEYKTLLYLEDEKGIVGAAHFNIEGDTAHILNTAVREDYRGRDILKQLVGFGFCHFPYVKNLRFENARTKKNFIIPINLFLGKEQAGGHKN